MERPSSAPDASADAESLDAAAQARPGSDQAAPEPGALAAGGVQSPEDPEGTRPTIFRGTDAVFRRPNPLPPVRLQGEAVSLNFEQAPLTEVVHAVLGDILELDYFVEHPINGQVTLRTRTPVERAQLLDILESLLKANKAHLVRDANGRFLVSASGQMARLKPQITTSAENAVGFSTLIVPLQYISASSMAEILAPVAEETSFVR
ncbi:MAG: type II secretion system protein GspD, partial [Halioglobus sp.]|nr:type II secretion system protein GspD [Halioglobus sp.]